MTKQPLDLVFKKSCFFSLTDVDIFVDFLLLEKQLKMLAQ